jgi:ankyrin repeat protein
MFSAANGHTETVKALIDGGADVDAETKKGTTALKFAASKGHTEMVEILSRRSLPVSRPRAGGSQGRDPSFGGKQAGAKE